MEKETLLPGVYIISSIRVKRGVLPGPTLFASALYTILTVVRAGRDEVTID